MKRYGNLWPQVTAFANLLAAAKQAQRGKRFRDNVLKFNADLETEILRLQTELQTKTYVPGQYRTFEIVEPKRRLISVAPYRDRVVHHAVCNVIVPRLERSFIADSYANRQGFGTHRALRRFTQFARSSRYVLQCDIQKYFPSIDHEILKSLLRQKLKCADTLWLLDTLSACETGMIGMKNIEEVVGLPASLLQAGVAGVVASLWSVNDLSTALLMIKFYECFFQNPSDTAVALRTAQRWLRDATQQELLDWAKSTLSGDNLKEVDKKPYEKPYYWAAFCAVGQ